MGRSLARVEADQEPPDVHFEHEISNRTYEVYRQDGRLQHRELLSSDDTEDPALLTDVEVGWVVGSGRYARTYLAEVDGFLVESPLTWYSKRQSWGMSPGYDRGHQRGFQRPIDETCLICHAGRFRAIEGSLHRIAIEESWIGCERCHGAGSLHVERWSDTSPGTGISDDQSEVDYSIVNPAHLTRDLSDAICAQCHLRSAASATVRNRRVSEFKPGLPLSGWRVDYRLAAADDSMTVVGHVEQLWLSRCYQGTELSCVTCHNPHGFPAEENRVEYYRDKCFQCHQGDDCNVDPEHLDRVSPANDCVACHMPSSDTDIPHFAFTHHRIGIHEAKELTGDPRHKTAPVRPGQLQSLVDLTGYSELDRDRMLGLAYLELSQAEHGAGHHQSYALMAFELLTRVWEEGLRDPELAGNLAALSAMFGSPHTLEYASTALTELKAPTRANMNATLAMANWHADHNELERSATAMREIVARRRVATDWEFLGDVEFRLGNQRASIAAFEKSLEIDPVNSRLRRRLIALFEELGQNDRASWHRKRVFPGP